MSADLARATSAPLAFSADILTGQLASSSIVMYRRDFTAYGAFARASGRSPADPATFARWRAALARDTQHSPNTINRMLSAVKRLMKEAADQGYIAHEAAEAFGQVRGVKINALRERIKPTARTRIAPADMRRICDAPDPATLRGLRDRALLATLASSGLRAAEAADLPIGAIHQHGTGYLLTVLGKGQAEPRDAPLSPEAYERIMVWVNARPIPSAAIFTAFDGRGNRPTDRAMSPVAVWQTVQEYAARCGLAHIKPHDFRRFVGTQLAKTDIRQAQKALGHKRIDTTARHYDLSELEPGLTDHLY